MPIVLMHNRDEARYAQRRCGGHSRPAARASIARSRRALPGSDLIVDPGIGFGKTPEHNLAVLHDLAALQVLGRPVLLGTSRKSTIGKVLDLPADQRLEGTLATTALGVAAGVDIIRVHDVQPNVRAARMADAVIRGHRLGPAMNGPHLSAQHGRSRATIGAGDGERERASSRSRSTSR